jgi:hypothetical protein
MAGKAGMRSGKAFELPATYGKGAVLDKLDGRSGLAAAYREQVGGLTSDLGGDLSVQQAMLVERAVWLHLHLRRLELEAARGDGLDINDYVSLVGSLTKVLHTLGLKRAQREIKTLRQVLKGDANG